VLAWTGLSTRVRAKSISIPVNSGTQKFSFMFFNKEHFELYLEFDLLSELPGIEMELTPALLST
jgi:hypothetical protein